MEKIETFFLVISGGSEKLLPLKHEISPVGRNDSRKTTMGEMPSLRRFSFFVI